MSEYPGEGCEVRAEGAGDTTRLRQQKPKVGLGGQVVREDGEAATDSPESVWW